MAKGPICSLVFVCAGNICRSPMAEGLLKQRLAAHPALGAITVSSAGTIAFDGNLPSADSVEADTCPFRNRHQPAPRTSVTRR